MIKTAYEYLFVVLSSRIAMVRKELDGFSVVPVSDSGDVFSSFEDPTQYWKDWVALTNFSIRHSEVDFAFLADKEDCRFAAENAKKPDQLKTAQQTVWTKKTVLSALQTSRELIGLPKAISVREKGEQLFAMNDGNLEEPFVLHLTRFGAVKDGKDEPQSVVKEQNEGLDELSDKEMTVAGNVVNEDSDQKQSKKEEIKRSLDIVGDSNNDPEALKLSVGDELKGTVVKIFNTMKRNYVKVEGLKEQVCFKSSDKTKFAVGDEVSMTVTDVDAEAKKVLFAVVKDS